MQTELTKLELASTFIDIPFNVMENRQYKDVNEWLQDADKETFKDRLEDSIYKKFDKEYLLNTMDDYFRELANYKNKPIKKTNFKILDEQLDGGIKSGLYVLGAIPSLRKNYSSFTNSR